MVLGEPTKGGMDRDREWRRRSAQRYAQKQREKGPHISAVKEIQKRIGIPRSKSPARNDGPWRKACIEVYGHTCIVPTCGSRDIEMDHIKPRSQGGESVVENGIPLCGPWSEIVDGGHHLMKTSGRIKFEWAWLTEAQRAYLAAIGWVDWDEDGKPFGEGWRHFTERTENG